MEWDNDFYLYLLSFILVPIGIAIYRKQKPKKEITDTELVIMKKQIENLEDNAVQLHIKIDDTRIRLAYLEGKGSK